MARIRSIKPSIWSDDRFVSLTHEARLLVIGMISQSDDEGRIIASGPALAGAVFPHDDISAKKVEKLRDEIARVGLIHVYTVGRGTYAYFPRWKRHQRIQKSQHSTLPAPPTSTGMGTRPGTRPAPQSTENGSATDSHTESATDSGTDRELKISTREVEVVPPPQSATESTTDQLIAGHIAALEHPPPNSVLDAITHLVEDLLAEGQPAPCIAAGLATMRAKRLSPRKLPELVAEAIPTTNNGAAAIPWCGNCHADYARYTPDGDGELTVPCPECHPAAVARAGRT